MPAFNVLKSFAAHKIASAVPFDATNPEHIQAYLMMTDKTSARQHPTLRFILEDPFFDMITMMHAKIAHAYVAMKFKTHEQLMSMIGEQPAAVVSNNVHHLGVKPAFQ